MKKAHSGNHLVFILISLLAVAVSTAGYFWWQGSRSVNAPNLVSGECGLCGPQGIHNVSGKTCAEGLVCKKDKTENFATSLSYCVKSDELVARCLTGEKQLIDETANWKTYANKKYIYSFLYPNDYYIQYGDTNAVSISLVPNGFSDLSIPQKMTTSTIGITVFSDTVTSDVWVRQKARGPGFNNIRNISTKIIAGRQATQFTSDNTQAGPMNSTNIMTDLGNNNLLLISLSNANNQSTHIYDQILSTFHFLK